MNDTMIVFHVRYLLKAKSRRQRKMAIEAIADELKRYDERAERTAKIERSQNISALARLMEKPIPRHGTGEACGPACLHGFEGGYWLASQLGQRWPGVGI